MVHGAVGGFRDDRIVEVICQRGFRLAVIDKCPRVRNIQLVTDIVKLVLQHNTVHQVLINIRNYIVFGECRLILNQHADIPVSAAENDQLFILIFFADFQQRRQQNFLIFKIFIVQHIAKPAVGHSAASHSLPHIIYKGFWIYA